MIFDLFYSEDYKVWSSRWAWIYFSTGNPDRRLSCDAWPGAEPPTAQWSLATAQWSLATAQWSLAAAQWTLAAAQ